MKRSLLFLLALGLLFVLPGCMTLFEVAPGPFANTSYVLAGRTPFPMGRVSLCHDNGCGEVFTYEDTGGLRIQSIATDSSLDGVWVVAGSPLIYRGKLYYCAVREGCSLQESFETFENLERIQVVLEEEVKTQRVETQRVETERRTEEQEKACDDLRESLTEQLRLAGVEEETARKMLEDAMDRSNCR